LLPVFVGVCVLVGVCVGVTAAEVGVGDGVGVGVAHSNGITTPLNISVLEYPAPYNASLT
jgi:hypothetical protein